MNEGNTRNVVYRVAEVKDLPTVALLYDMANYGQISAYYKKEAKPPQTWIDVVVALMQIPGQDIDMNRTIVAELDGKIAGARLTSINGDPIPEAKIIELPAISQAYVRLRNLVPNGFFLRDLAVFPEFRKLKIGSKLNDLAINVAQNLKMPHASSITHETNQLIIESWTRRGFVFVDRHRVGEGHPTYPADSFFNLYRLDFHYD